MITRCANEHWYDSSVYKTCPWCKIESEKLSIRLNPIEEDDHTIPFTDIDAHFEKELESIIDKTRNIFSDDLQDEQAINEEKDEDKTIGFFGETSEEPPVTGWLVCMTGDERGKDFRLHSGKNFIGRGASMDVRLVDDKTIEREKHCSVIYDPKGNEFYLSPELDYVVKLNQEKADAPIHLKEGDTITVGETILRFVPFCKEDLKW